MHHKEQKYYCFQFVKQNFINMRHVFWPDANRNTIQQQLLHTFFVMWSWSFGKEHWLGTRKAMPKINKKCLKNIFRDIWSVNNPIQVAAFFHTSWFCIMLAQSFIFSCSIVYKYIRVVHSKFSRTSKMELFAKIVNGWKAPS